MKLSEAKDAITKYSRHLEEHTFLGRGFIYGSSEADKAVLGVADKLFQNARAFWNSAKSDSSKLQKAWKYPVAVLAAGAGGVLALVDLTVIKIAKYALWLVGMILGSIEHGVRYALNSCKGIGNKNKGCNYRGVTYYNLHTEIYEKDSAVKNWIERHFPVYEGGKLVDSDSDSE